MGGYDDPTWSPNVDGPRWVGRARTPFDPFENRRGAHQGAGEWRPLWTEAFAHCVSTRGSTTQTRCRRDADGDRAVVRREPHDHRKVGERGIIETVLGNDIAGATDVGEVSNGFAYSFKG